MSNVNVVPSVMSKRRIRTTAWLAVLILAGLLPAASSSATMMTFGGVDDPSLHGATGSLSIVEQGGHYVATWSMDFTGYQADATHQYLTDVAFKAFNDPMNVSVLGGSFGDLYAPSNVNNGGCDTTDSSAGFVCLSLNPEINATMGGSFSVSFQLDGTLLDEWSYRGKFGDGNGWVISESSTNAIPEPTAALLFVVGAGSFGAVRRRLA